MNGEGTMMYWNGYKYVGGWVDDEESGEATATGSNGKVIYKGKWKNGIFTFCNHDLLFCAFSFIFYFFTCFCDDFLSVMYSENRKDGQR
jgi:hypothetical protein